MKPGTHRHLHITVCVSPSSPLSSHEHTQSCPPAPSSTALPSHFTTFTAMSALWCPSHPPTTASHCHFQLFHSNMRTLVPSFPPQQPQPPRNIALSPLSTYADSPLPGRPIPFPTVSMASPGTGRASVGDSPCCSEGPWGSHKIRYSPATTRIYFSHHPLVSCLGLSSLALGSWAFGPSVAHRVLWALVFGRLVIHILPRLLWLDGCVIHLLHRL